MIRSLIAGVALAALLPMQAMAQDEDAGYQMWMASEGDLSRWAVIAPDGETASYAMRDGDEPATVLTGQAAVDAIADVEIDLPEVVTVDHDFHFNFDHDFEGEFTEDIKVFAEADGKKVKVLRLDGDESVLELDIEKMLEESGIDFETDVSMDDNVSSRVTVKTWNSDDGETIDLEELLEDKGISIDGDITIDHDGEKKHIVIRSGKKKTTFKPGDDMKIEAETKDGEKTEIRIMRMPEPPTPPEPGTNLEWRGEDGHNVLVKSGKNTVRTVTTDKDGVKKSYIHLTGVSAEDAEEFIDDIEGLTTAQKREMKAALSL